jgi:hypothetical protein
MALLDTCVLEVLLFMGDLYRRLETRAGIFTYPKLLLQHPQTVQFVCCHSPELGVIIMDVAESISRLVVADEEACTEICLP